MGQQLKFDNRAVLFLLILIGIAGLVFYWRGGVEDTPGDFHVKTGNYRLEGGQFAWLDSWYFCVGPDYGCIDPSACNYDPGAYDASGLCDYGLDVDQNGVCDTLEVGVAPPFCGEGTVWDANLGQCIGVAPAGAVPGCTYTEALNFQQEATDDDGTCTFPEVNPCPTDIDGDGVTSVPDLLLLLGEFEDLCGE